MVRQLLWLVNPVPANQLPLSQFSAFWNIVLKPDFLILDEPTSALDMTSQAQVINLLLDLQKKYSITYMFISHDLRVVRALADQVAVMQHGRIVEAGPAREIFATPRQEYTKTLFRAALEGQA